MAGSASPARTTSRPGRTTTGGSTRSSKMSAGTRDPRMYGDTAADDGEDEWPKKQQQRDVLDASSTTLVQPWRKTQRVLQSMGVMVVGQSSTSEDVEPTQSRKGSFPNSGSDPDGLHDDDGADYEQSNQNSITIPHGFQLSRSYLQPHPTVKDILFLGTGSSNKDSFAVMDHHTVNVIREFGPPINLPITNDSKNKSSPVSGLSRWVFIKKWRVVVIATLQLELKILGVNFQELYSISSVKPVLSLEFNDERNELIAGGVGNIRIWTFLRTNDKALPFKFGPPRLVVDDLRAQDWITHTFYEKTSRKLYAVVDQTLLVYDYTNGELLESLENIHELAITSVNFYEPAELETSQECLGMKWMREDTFCHFSKDKISVWNLNRYYSQFTKLPSKIAHLKRVSNGTAPARILVGSEDGAVKIVSPVTGLAIYTAFPSMKESRVVDIHYDLQLGRIWTLSETGDISVFSCQSNPCQTVDEWKYQAGKEKPLCFSPVLVAGTSQNEGKETLALLTGTDSGQIVAYYIHQENGAPQIVMQAHAAEITLVKVFNERNVLITAAKDGTVKLWNIKVQQSQRASESPALAERAASNSTEPYVLIEPFNSTAGAPFLNLTNNYISVCSYNLKNNCLAVGLQPHNLVYYRLDQSGFRGERGRHAADEEHVGAITCIANLETLNIFATSSKDGTVKIWDANDSSLLREIQFGEAIHSVCFCNDRGDLLVGQTDQVVLVRIQDYLPLNILSEVLVRDWTDDVVETPPEFDPSIDFWQHYKNKMEEEGKSLDGWHIQKTRVEFEEDPVVDDILERKIEALAQKVAADETKPKEKFDWRRFRLSSIVVPETSKPVISRRKPPAILEVLETEEEEPKPPQNEISITITDADDESENKPVYHETITLSEEVLSRSQSDMSITSDVSDEEADDNYFEEPEDLTDYQVRPRKSEVMSTLKIREPKPSVKYSQFQSKPKKGFHDSTPRPSQSVRPSNRQNAAQPAQIKISSSSAVSYSYEDEDETYIEYSDDAGSPEAALTVSSSLNSIAEKESEGDPKVSPKKTVKGSVAKSQSDLRKAKEPLNTQQEIRETSRTIDVAVEERHEDLANGETLEVYEPESQPTYYNTMSEKRAPESRGSVDDYNYAYPEKLDWNKVMKEKEKARQRNEWMNMVKPPSKYMVKSNRSSVAHARALPPSTNEPGQQAAPIDAATTAKAGQPAYEDLPPMILGDGSSVYESIPISSKKKKRKSVMPVPLAPGGFGPATVNSDRKQSVAVVPPVGPLAIVPPQVVAEEVIPEDAVKDEVHEEMSPPIPEAEAAQQPPKVPFDGKFTLGIRLPAYDSLAPSARPSYVEASAVLEEKLAMEKAAMNAQPTAAVEAPKPKTQAQLIREHLIKLGKLPNSVVTAVVRQELQQQANFTSRGKKGKGKEEVQEASAIDSDSDKDMESSHEHKPKFQSRRKDKPVEPPPMPPSASRKPSMMKAAIHEDEDDEYRSGLPALNEHHNEVQEPVRPSVALKPVELSPPPVEAPAAVKVEVVPEQKAPEPVLEQTKEHQVELQLIEEEYELASEPGKLAPRQKKRRPSKVIKNQKPDPPQQVKNTAGPSQSRRSSVIKDFALASSRVSGTRKPAPEPNRLEVDSAQAPVAVAEDVVGDPEPILSANLDIQKSEHCLARSISPALTPKTDEAAEIVELSTSEASISSYTSKGSMPPKAESEFKLKVVDEDNHEKNAWDLFDEAIKTLEGESPEVDVGDIRQELKKVMGKYWFPGLGGRQVNLENMVEVLLYVMKQGTWQEKCDASKAILYLFKTFNLDLKDPLHTMVLPQLYFLNDPNWQVLVSRMQKDIQSQLQATNNVILSWRNQVDPNIQLWYQDQRPPSMQATLFKRDATDSAELMSRLKIEGPVFPPISNPCGGGGWESKAQRVLGGLEREVGPGRQTRNPSMVKLPKLPGGASDRFIGASLMTRANQSTGTTRSVDAHTMTSPPSPTSEEEEPDDAPIHDDSKVTENLLCVVIRQDLSMTKGKSAAQASHGALAAFTEALENNPESVGMWQSEGSKVVIKKTNGEETIYKIQQRAEEFGLTSMYIEDAGRTQIEAGSITVVAIGPGQESVISVILNEFNLQDLN
ncbi:hypothetical protein HDV05_000279 [Chytridiales sp. JEL 0842]|nr:hypothetical protein HDV05_000279 [Chytridiales sp. JEL 0842]